MPMQTSTPTFEPGTVLDLTFAAHEDETTARVKVERKWKDDEDFDGLKVERVTADYPTTIPRYQMSLFPADGTLRDNYFDAEEGETRPEAYDVERIDVVDLADRITVEGSLDSPRASHVKRAVLDAVDAINSPDSEVDDEDIDAALAASEWVKPEEIMLQAAGERSDTEGVTLVYTAAMDLQTEEKIRETLRERLNDDYGMWPIRQGVWEFYYDDGIEKPVR